MEQTLLEQLKGQKWERITADESKHLQQMLYNLPYQTPFMYSEELSVQLQILNAKDQGDIIRGFSALKKLGILKRLHIKVIRNNIQSLQDFIQKISEQLGKITTIKELQVSYEIYIKEASGFIEDLYRIQSLQRFKFVQQQVPQQGQLFQDVYESYQEGFAMLLKNVVKCQNLKALSLEMINTNKVNYQDEFKEQLENLSQLKNLEDFRFQTDFEKEQFYEAFGHIVAKLPSLRIFKLMITIDKSNSSTQIQNQSQGLILLAKQLIKSQTIVEIQLDIMDDFQLYSENYLKALETLSSLKSLTSLKLVFSEMSVQQDQSIMKSLQSFHQLQSLALEFNFNFHNSFIEGIGQLKQLKKLQIFSSSFSQNFHQEKKLLAKHLRELKNLTYLQVPSHFCYLKDLYRYLPNLVMVIGQSEGQTCRNNDIFN